jgi:cardiolipin synthase
MSDSNHSNGSKFSLFSSAGEWHKNLLEDIAHAQKYVFIEIYRFKDDEIGRKFLSALSKKCKEGIEVLLLVDSWGTNVSETFFNPIIKHGGKVIFYEKLKFTWDFISSNHQRNHRKIVVIDDKISHVGSANITEYSKNWRESIVRVEGEIALVLKKILLHYVKNANNQFYKKKHHKRNIKFEDFLIIQDFPSIYQQKVKIHYERIIKKANKEIDIVTPYFLPGFKLRRLLIMAARKNIDVNIYTPNHSDVKMVDYIRDKYLGQLHRSGIKIWFYNGENLHAKLLCVDSKKYVFGSTNFDYRSFRYMHEIMIQGQNPELGNKIYDFIKKTEENCVPFDYHKWKNRSRISKIVGWLLIPFRHLF